MKFAITATQYLQTFNRNTAICERRCNRCSALERQPEVCGWITDFISTTGNNHNEGIREGLGGIGKDEETDLFNVWTTNDRVIFSWQTYAGRYDDKTVDRHLSAIRLLEVTLGGKHFDQLTNTDVGLVREGLKQSLLAGNELRRSKSTVAHTASHLAAFLQWLLKQDGYKRLPRDLPDYLKLPKAVYSASLARKEKDYPTLEEAQILLKEMPDKSLRDQRSKAIFALAFLSGMRADTLASLRICHFDPANELIIQDATTVRAKNGKSLNVNWFPISKEFSQTILDWVTCLDTLGFRDFDALFPSQAILINAKHINKYPREPIAPTSTKHVVTEAFRIACRNSAVKYTPHSAKHTLGAERDARHLTREQRKAWSEAMGHENEQITDVHYGLLTDERRTELFRQIADGKSDGITELTDEAKIRLADMVLTAIKQP